MPKAAEPPQASGMQTLVKPQSVTVTKVHSDALMGARRARVLMGLIPTEEVVIPTGQRRGEKNLKGHARESLPIPSRIQPLSPRNEGQHTLTSRTQRRDT